MSEQPKGWHIVGDHGPELIDFRGGTKITSWEELLEYFRKLEDDE